MSQCFNSFVLKCKNIKNHHEVQLQILVASKEEGKTCQHQTLIKTWRLFTHIAVGRQNSSTTLGDRQELFIEVDIDILTTLEDRPRLLIKVDMYTLTTLENRPWLVIKVDIDILETHSYISTHLFQENWKRYLCNSCTQMSIEALFAIINTWKNTKCPPTN